MTYREMKALLSPVWGEREAGALVDYVLWERFGLSKADVLCGMAEQMSSDDSAEMDMIMSRLVQAEPVQYVLGNAEFCGRRFNVRPGVLIPRPETEELCRMIKAERDGKTGQRILDIGTGSGCIAVTLSLEMPGNEVSAFDVSREALSVARENASLLGARVEFKKQDILAAEPQSGAWDVIVSNPPYIRESERKTMNRNVTEHEPELALFVPDADPLMFYRAICRYAAGSLRSGGMLYFEINEAFGSETANMMRSFGFSDVVIVNDEYGKERMVKGTF